MFTLFFKRYFKCLEYNQIKKKRFRILIQIPLHLYKP